MHIKPAKREALSGEIDYDIYNQIIRKMRVIFVVRL